MLIRTDPFRDLDRLAEQMLGAATRPSMMPMDAWQDGDEYVVELDLPGVDPDHIDLDVERNVVTIRAERPERQQLMIGERPHGSFRRQLVLGDALDAGKIRAGYDSGVLVLRIPVHERSKPRRIEVASGGGLPKSIGSAAGHDEVHAASATAAGAEEAAAT